MNQLPELLEYAAKIRAIEDISDLLNELERCLQEYSRETREDQRMMKLFQMKEIVEQIERLSNPG